MNPKSIKSLKQEGAVGGSHYRTILKLGEGGMAEVFLAMQQGLADIRRLVVIKRLRATFAHAIEYQEMFLEEARLATRLNHPNIVHTYEVGRENDQHFIAMEYLAGRSLNEILGRLGKERGDMSTLLCIIVEVLKGLEYAHKQTDLQGTPLQLVHRDISPSNIFITYDGRIKILDFGIAKSTGSAVETKVGTIKGKLTYMAPEQAKRENVSQQADLYAVGVMLWELVAGRRRWAADLGEVAIFGLLLENRAPEPPGAAARGLPSELDAICVKVLNPSPEHRFADAADFRQALEKVLRGVPRQRTPESVGALVASLFAAEREDQARQIENGIRQSQLSVPEMDAQTLLWRKVDGPQTSRPTVALAGGPEETFLQGKARRRLLGGALVVAVAVAVAFAYSGRAEESEALQGEPLAPVRDEVVVTIVASPPEAMLRWNERILMDNPTVERHLSSDEVVRVRAEADGYEAEERVLALRENVDLVFNLRPQAPKSNPVTVASLPSIQDQDAPESSAPQKNKQRIASPVHSPVPPAPKGKISRVKLDTSDPWSD